MGDPMMCAKLQALIFNLTQWTPSENWMRRFLKENVGQITMKRVHRLNPKHAQAFNWLVMEHHFKHLESLIIRQGIPSENIYNQDEKGIQLGGGRKNLPLQYIFSSNDC